MVKLVARNGRAKLGSEYKDKTSPKEKIKEIIRTEKHTASIYIATRKPLLYAERHPVRLVSTETSI